MILFLVFTDRPRLTTSQAIQMEVKIKKVFEAKGIFTDFGLQTLAGIDPFIVTGFTGSPSVQTLPYALAFNVVGEYSANHNDTYKIPGWRHQLQNDLEQMLFTPVYIVN